MKGSGRGYRAIVDEVIDPDRLAERIRDGLSVNEKMSGERVPLAIAALHGALQSCRLLLEAGADPNVLDFDDVPLSRAIVGRGVKSSDLESMRAVCGLLVECGADPNGFFSSIDYQPPIRQAVKAKDHEAIRMLAGFGADMNPWVRPSGKRAPERLLEMVRREGDEATLVALLRCGANDRILAKRGFTAFQWCVKDGFDEAVRYYAIERGEDLSQKAKNGRSLLQLARKESTRHLLRALKTDLAVQNALDGKELLRPKKVASKIEERLPEWEASPYPPKIKNRGIPPL